MRKLTSLDDIFVHELQATYDAEHQILKAFPAYITVATHPDLTATLEMHRRETRVHVERLERVFDMIGVEARGNKSYGMAGLLVEGAKIMEEEAGPEILDAALISSLQKLEHYEIAAYGCLCTYAEMLGYDQAHDLLCQTLDEEETIDQKLTELAESVFNPQAVEGEWA